MKRKFFIKKGSKTKEISIKRIRTILDIKTIWNQVLKDVIEKKSIKKKIQNKINSNQKN